MPIIFVMQGKCLFLDISRPVDAFNVSCKLHKLLGQTGICLLFHAKYINYLGKDEISLTLHLIHMNVFIQIEIYYVSCKIHK